MKLQPINRKPCKWWRTERKKLEILRQNLEENNPNIRVILKDITE